MEADWSVALGGDDPVIVVPWAAANGPRFVDLRAGAHLIDEIEEARTSPELRAALLHLNQPNSPFWTAKCDVWTTSVEAGDPPADPYELDAVPGETDDCAGSYIDLLPRDLSWFASFERHEQWLRAVTRRLRLVQASAARAEVILRPAEVDALPGFAVTWVVEGCGPTARDADAHWHHALRLTLPVIMQARERDESSANELSSRLPRRAVGP